MERSQDTEAAKQKRQISLSIVALLALVLAVGVFSLRRVSMHKAELRELGEQVLTLSSTLTKLESEKVELAEVAREVLRSLRAGQVSSEHPTTSVREHLDMFTQILRRQADTIEMLDQYTTRFIANLREGVEVGPLESVVLRSRADIERFRELVATVGADTEFTNAGTQQALSEIVESARRAVPRLSSDIGEIFVVLSSRTLSRVEQLEQAATVEIALITGMALLLGIFVSRRMRRLQRSLVEAKQLAALGKIAVALQHEINNPLAVIIGNAYIVRSTETSAAERDAALRAVEEAAMRIASVVQHTKDLERLRTTEYLEGVEMIDLGGIKPKQ
jgi:hypothetical protein